MESPVSANENGISLRPELMEKERMYHCVFRNKVMLVFMDSQDMLNCYEIEEKEIVDRARECKGGDLGAVFEEYIKEHASDKT